MSWEFHADGNIVVDMPIAIGAPPPEWTIKPHQGEPDMSGTFTIVGADDALFSQRSPKTAGIKTVKLTEDNLKLAGAYILKTIGGTVDVADGGLRVGNHFFAPGQWLVEEYDYLSSRVTFHAATLGERVKYDLR